MSYVQFLALLLKGMRIVGFADPSTFCCNELALLAANPLQWMNGFGKPLINFHVSFTFPFYSFNLFSLSVSFLFFPIQPRSQGPLLPVPSLAPGDGKERTLGTRLFPIEINFVQAFLLYHGIQI